MLPALFALTLFLSAALLFVVQPMAGKELLPLAGGASAVWATCLVFFQSALLLGYLYAHRLTAVRPRWQPAVHLPVAVAGLLAVAFLQPEPEWIPADQDYPVIGLIGFLTVLVGVPFFALAATAPLLQRWFVYTGHPSARDPYFLYAASNAGSLLGLLAYPFLIQPSLTLGEQRAVWGAGLMLVVGLLALCGLRVWFGKPSSPSEGVSPPPGTSPTAGENDPPPTRRRLLKWVALAALPSSLLMGVTTHLTTDVAPVPLLWVVPLTLYLLSFVMVFARWPKSARLGLGRFTPMLLVFLVIALLTGATEPIAAVAAVHLAAFFAVALLCHGELAHDRPTREHLTTFYLALSVGGVLGGLFNALLAPVLFCDLGLVEYPLAIVAAALVRPDSRGLTPLRLRGWDALLVMAFVAVAAGLTLLIPEELPGSTDSGAPAALLRRGLLFGLPAAGAFALVASPLRFALCLAGLMAIGSVTAGPHGRVLEVERNFFGTLQVTRSPDERFVRLIHGTTVHGQQYANTPGPPKPLTYYHPEGPAGRLLIDRRRTVAGLLAGGPGMVIAPAPSRFQRVAVVGLGVGALAAYAVPDQEWTFYEIDPAVVRIARDSGHFTFLAEARVAPRIVLGDARRQLAKEPDGHFDLIILDAFSSDAIPVHLLTQEAFALYVRKLAPNGILAFHLSNRYLDLPPFVARLGAAQEPPFLMRVNQDWPSERQQEDGKFPSVWGVLFRQPTDLGPLAKDVHWQPLPPTPGPIWRDDFSDVLAAWRGEE